MWTLNLENVPDKVPPLPADAVISACAWSDDGLVAFASSATRSAGHASQWGYTSTPAIFVVHVDHPERHSQLSGGHEHEIAHLSWVHRQMGIVLMSADERSCICLWKPVQVSRLVAASKSACDALPMLAPHTFVEQFAPVLCVGGEALYEVLHVPGIPLLAQSRGCHEDAT